MGKARSGVCAQCGSRKVSERNGQIVYCPNGCSHEMSGEAFLELMDATGSGWIRDALKKGQP
jgi:ribosomal protein L37AE/L43A